MKTKEDAHEGNGWKVNLCITATYVLLIVAAAYVQYIPASSYNG